ncbi:C-terminal binding protein [Cytobacillus oceanisediminis]|uniref:C-terminal binding protein n=1 Tax=Cytobacillus oceanisediminis TaxID=665099 RepID=UPI001CCF9835|nr:C-terminal binding protein [Cytobacillus oceanisediminis]MBZ9535822.1 C-terminal binding protein [Cytobacillus oceanisediminis]
MKNKLIVITDCDHPSVDIEKEVLEKQGFTVRLEQCYTEEDVIDKCQDAVGLINQYAPLTKRVLSSLPNCKVVVRYGVGVDNVDTKAAEECNVQICNVPDYGVEEVSDHALALLFSLTRKITLLSNSVKQNQWDFQISRPITRLKDLTLGVVGLGRIGYALANKAKGLGWNVIGFDNNIQDVEGIEMVSFEELITKSDMISVHVPLNDATHHLFNIDVFKKMKSNAVIVNTARGPIIDEKALTEAISSGEITGAGIDVMENEPPIKDHPLFSFDNVLLTPHAAWYSEQASYDLKRKAAEEAANVVLGNKPKNPVNKIVGLEV